MSFELVRLKKFTPHFAVVGILSLLVFFTYTGNKKIESLQTVIQQDTDKKKASYDSSHEKLRKAVETFSSNSNKHRQVAVVFSQCRERGTECTAAVINFNQGDKDWRDLAIDFHNDIFVENEAVYSELDSLYSDVGMDFEGVGFYIHDIDMTTSE